MTNPTAREIAENVIIDKYLGLPRHLIQEDSHWNEPIRLIESALKDYGNQKLEEAARLADKLEDKYSDNSGVIGVGDEILKLKEE